MFLFDDRAIRQSDFARAEDCIMLEFISKEELEIRYKGNKHFDQEAIEQAVETQVEESEYGIQTRDPQVTLYHYYNRRTMEYCIMINKNALICAGDLPYPDGELPFVVTQHYPNNACIY